MPGSAGGGHSGGGHSGSFGGGGSRSGGSSHSSFGSGRSSSSSYSRSGSSYRSSGGYRPVYRSGGGYSRGGRSAGGCLTGVAGAFIVPLLIVIALFLLVGGILTNKTDNVKIGPENFTGEVTSEVVWADRLDESLCKPIKKTVVTDMPDILPKEGVAAVKEAIAGFYDKSGVQPYFMLMNGIKGDIDPDYDTVNDYLYDTYVDTFGEDEGHIIILLLMDEDYNYSSWYIIGDDAMTITDDAACETILDLIDEYAPDSKDVADVVSRAFNEAADALMSTVEYHYYDESGSEVNADDIVMDIVGGEKYALGMMGVVALGVVLCVVLLVRALKKRSKSAANPAAGAAANPAANTAANAYKQVNPAQNVNNGDSKPAQTKPPRANYPVTCPYCGATAYPKDDGTCEYCGSKIH